MNSTVFGPDPVGSVLKWRGFTIEGRGNNRDILLPLDRTVLSGETCNEFRRLFAHISFRKVCREIILGRGDLETLGQIASGAIEEYINFLKGLDVIEVVDSNVVLTRPLDNIGLTLEWYVADLCQSDFGGSSEWSVELSDVEHGDYDVIAWLPPSLIYVETKSSRQSELDESVLGKFFKRGQELTPELAILLVDTEESLEELMQRLSNVIWRIAGGTGWEQRISSLPDYRLGNVGFGYRRYYVMNSDPSIRTQLQRCLRHYHKEVKGRTTWE